MGQRLSKNTRNCLTFVPTWFYPIFSKFPALFPLYFFGLTLSPYNFCGVFFPPDLDFFLSPCLCPVALWPFRSFPLGWVTVGCLSLAVIPYFLPHVLQSFAIRLQKPVQRIYLFIFPILYFYLKTGLRFIYQLYRFLYFAVFHSINRMKFCEKNIICYTKDTVLCLYHTEGSWELSK